MMTDLDGHRIEAALGCGFEMTNDDGDEFRCTEAQLLDLIRRAEVKGRVEVGIRSYQRENVYGVLDRERAYQDGRSGETGGVHTVTEWSAYLAAYGLELLRISSFTWGAECKHKQLDLIRKLTTMGVACQEQNGVVERGS